MGRQAQKCFYKNTSQQQQQKSVSSNQIFVLWLERTVHRIVLELKRYAECLTMQEVKLLLPLPKELFHL